MTLTINSK